VGALLALLGAVAAFGPGVPVAGATTFAARPAFSLQESYWCPGTPWGDVVIPGSTWAPGVPGNNDIYSNYNGTNCANGYSQTITFDGAQELAYQCTEIAVRWAKNYGGVPATAWDNAGWDGAAQDMYGLDVSGIHSYPNGGSTKPQFGDLLIWTDGSGPGHVAVVVGTSGGRLYFVGENEDYGEDYVDYDSSTNTASSAPFDAGTVTGWIRFTNPTSGTPANGSFVSYGGNVYRMVGGAPLYVSSWAAVGGEPSGGAEALSSSQWSQLAAVPSNGSLVDVNGAIYEIAGGAPLYVSNFKAIGGSRSSVKIDPWDLEHITNSLAHLHAVPSNGTFVNAVTASGAEYGAFVIAGGAPMYISNWSAVGGEPSGLTQIDAWDIQNISNSMAHLHAVPSNGTLLDSDTAIYEVAGGAPLYVSNFKAIGGSRPGVNIDPWDLQNISNPRAHLRSRPSNGTFVNAVTASGAEYGAFVIAGGAPMYISNWSAVGGEPSGLTQIDAWDIQNPSNAMAHLSDLPATGTFITTSTGNVYRIAGGAAFYVHSWSVFGGVKPSTKVDEWDLENFSSPLSHLLGSPLNGTIVQALPTSQDWIFQAGKRSPISSSKNVTPVDKVGLNRYPQASSPHASCIAPRLHHLTLGQARRKLDHAHCTLGRVKHAKHHHGHHKLRVISQTPAPRTKHKTNYPINIKLS
jgi:hypothetical protein